MKVFRILVTVLLLAAVGGRAEAFLNSHGPFEKGRAPGKFPLKKCRQLAVTGSWKKLDRAWVYAATKGKKVRFKLHVKVSAQPRGILVSVTNEHGATVAGPVQVAPWIHFTGARWADLNGDGREDFVVTVGSGGCGLAVGRANVAFILSAGWGYRITAVRTMFPGPEDFIDPSGKGECLYVQASFVYGEKGRDGKAHNYWVYNLLRPGGGFRRREVVLANGRDRRFPKWIWYTNNPNHQATTQLTAAQKRRLWRPQAAKVFWEPGYPGKAAVKYVLGKVKCSNPEEVCRIVFGGYSPEDPEDMKALLGRTSFEKEDLGDGTKCYIFEPPGGCGSYAAIFLYHFAKQGDRLVLLFDSGGLYCGHSTDKVNGRYVIVQTWRADLCMKDVELATRACVWFWNGRRYVEAYTETTIHDAKDKSRIGTTVKWNPANKKAFLRAAPRDLVPGR